jgi:hypothetical protein
LFVNMILYRLRFGDIHVRLNYPRQDLDLAPFEFRVYSRSWNRYINLKFPVSMFRAAILTNGARDDFSHQ